MSVTFNSSVLLSEWEEQDKHQNSLKGQMTVPYWVFYPENT